MKKILLHLCISLWFSQQAYAAVSGNFTDNMATTDPNAPYWTVSDGWSNGNPFDTCWKKSQVTRQDGFAVLQLSTPSPSPCVESTIGPEYTTNRFYGYGTYSFSLKAPVASSGVVMGAFNYKGPYTNENGNPTHNEIDIEFLKGGVQFNYYHNHKGGHEYFLTATQLGFNPSDNFHTYSFSWKAGKIIFAVDGITKLTRTADVPLASEGGLKIMVNVWRCTDTISSWCGIAPASLDTRGYVDWVKYTTK
jgi:endo-1,3-1,4-beta-glycanase ExoK